MRKGCFIAGRCRSVLLGLLAWSTVSMTWADESARFASKDAERAARILAGADYQSGLIVHLGCGDGRLTAALGSADHAVVQGLDTDSALVAVARDHLRETVSYGRISVGTFAGKQLPYTDNLVNLVVVSDRAAQVPDEEILRVLRPGGQAWYESKREEQDPEAQTADADDRWRQVVKPWPEELDQWTHFLYGASGNAVSRDRRVAPLQRLQWDGGPRWSRSHETDMSLTAAVVSGGRIFFTLDEGPIGVHETPRERRRLPDKSSLVARDAFNGIELWKRPLPDWGSAAWDNARWRWGIADQLWSSPLTLPRRLVAAGDRLYVTLGFRAHVSELDAATGETLREFPETQAAEEIVIDQQILVARVREEAAEASGESIVAIGIESGEVLWREPVPAVADLTLAVHDGRVCFHDTSRLVALDLHTGQQLWQTEPRPPEQRRINEGTLVMAENTVIFAAPSVLDVRCLTDGSLLWRRKTNTSFRGMPDVFVIDNLVWAGTLSTTGLDLRTGTVAREIDPGHLFTGGHHARCYRGKATENYLLWSKRGVEFLDLHGDDHQQHDWVRGTCRYGYIPANGLLYAPPDPCFCYPGVKLTGFNALAGAAESTDVPAGSAAARLAPGPAYMKDYDMNASQAGGEVASGDWPTYRRDNARSGSAGTVVPSEITLIWQTELSGKVSPPVVVGDRLFVAEVDAHRVTCLDAGDGSRLWSFTADGPVDSPPTIHDGRVVFGSTDGSVYCLRATDGELVWRFQAAPSHRRIVSYERIESAWPVHGSVLIEDGIVYFAAGRSSFLDGGLYLYGLDVVTGEVRHQAHLDGPHPDLSEPSDRAHEMDGSKNDILVSNGERLFLTQNVFDLELKPVEAPQIAKWGARQTDLRLVATGGFLDDSGFDRLFWMHARRWPGLYVADSASKAGQILVFDDTTTYGLQTFNTKFSRSPYFAFGTQGHALFADDNTNEPELTDEAARRERGSMSRRQPPKWSVTIPVRARSMVLAGDTLFLAGPPEVIDPDDPYGAFEGRRGGRLWAVSTKDGSKLAEYPLDSPPVFDGLIAAQQNLFMTTIDHVVSCWGPARPAEPVQPLMGESPATVVSDDSQHEIDELYGLDRRLMDRFAQQGITIGDYHVHLRGGMTVDKAVHRQAVTGIRIGVLKNVGRGWPIETDQQLREFIDSVQGKPVLVGLQVNDRDWMTHHAADLLSRLDFVLADTMIMPMPNDDSPPVKLWLSDQYEIEDPEAWMERYLRHNLRVLAEPITILANPTYLPPAVEHLYDQLWSDDRMKAVVQAAVQNGVALEINARSGYPHDRFIRIAKEMGAKFTFGTNNFDDQPIRMDRCLRVVTQHGFTKDDIFLPVPR